MDSQSLKSQSQGNFDPDETAKIYSRYNRNYRAVGGMWIIFTLCFAIILLVVFFQPQWIGDSKDSPGTGYFGLHEYCELTKAGSVQMCSGRYYQFSTIISDAFIAATFFIGFAGLLIVICICCMVLFLFLSPSTVFTVCSWIQVVTCIFIFLGCIIYPAGWNNDKVQRICGADADQYNPGQCSIRWAYILAIISGFDALILAILGFVLASRYIQSPAYKNYNAYHNDIDSKPSMIIQPNSDHHSLHSAKN